jgi:uncharacterized membrane protein
MEIARTTALIVATLAMGLMAGVFGLYSIAIMPGLERTNDRTFVGAFQEIDTAIINPLFLLTFFGALVVTGLSAGLHLGKDFRSVLPWIVVALVLYLAVVVATVAVNVPLNDDIKAAGDPDRLADLAGVREQFNEARWVGWNHFRTVATIAAFGCLTWALVLFGRVGSPDGP